MLRTFPLSNEGTHFHFSLKLFLFTTMKSAAVVNFAPEKGSVEIREIEKPTIGSEDVLLEVANVGVCGSDLASMDRRSLAGQ